MKTSSPAIAVQDTKLPFSPSLPVSRKRFAIVLATFFFLFGLILLIAFFLLSNWMIDKKEREQFRTETYLQMDGKRRFIDLYLDDLSRSLQSIAYNPYFLSYVVDPAHIKQAEFLFLTIMLEHADYMQLRFIGADGVERLRFDRRYVCCESEHFSVPARGSAPPRTPSRLRVL
jgi:hypothetical protein